MGSVRRDSEMTTSKIVVDAATGTLLLNNLLLFSSSRRITMRQFLAKHADRDNMITFERADNNTFFVLRQYAYLRIKQTT